MTLEQFNSPIWTGGMKVRYQNLIWDVSGVDFEYKHVDIELNDNFRTVSYLEIEIVKDGGEDE